MATMVVRRIPIGAEPVGNGTHFRVWAPLRKSVQVLLPGLDPVSLVREDGGYFSGLVESAKAGMRYRFRLDEGNQEFPDPASRFQPEGPHGPSEIVNPNQYRWADASWPGIEMPGQVIYEMHIGTFTPEGTWKAASQLLPHLAETGITLLEIMPVADFAGGFGWGYDGVSMFAPTRLYGAPDDFRAFVDRAHQLGLGVILDVVYNHFGPDGNYLMEFSKDYVSDRYENEWGDPINFDGPNSEPVREFIVSNARYWIEEFHIDGLRLDATQQIFDSSNENIIVTINREARRAASPRSIVLIAENEPQLSMLVRPIEAGGYGMDAVWNDDFHHAARVALAGRTEAYYSDYRGTPQEFISALKWGYLYQGQYYSWQRQGRGTPSLDLPPASFVTYVQNHDQVANSARGSRIHQLAAPGQCRAITAILLLGPNTPLLFQGQEYGASQPFLFFSDHNEQLAELVEKGRTQFLSQFPSLANGDAEFIEGRPNERRTFERCILDHSERERHPHWLALHKDLLRLRKEDPVFRSQRRDTMHGAVLGLEAFLIRFFDRRHGDRLLLVNLGVDLRLHAASEPLLAAPAGTDWDVLWSSEDPEYGGSGTPPMRQTGKWTLPGHSAVVMYERTGN